MQGLNLTQLCSWRRDLHRYPEIGWTEFATTAKIVTILRESGFKLLLGPEILHKDYIRGRNEDLVAQALEDAKHVGIDINLLAEMQQLPGCMAVLDTKRPGPTLAFRFDIDCVNVSETDDPGHLPNQHGFASTRAGLMHSCGHDGHTAIGLGLAQWLVNNQDKLCGRFKLIFQPAEEGVRGARPIAESGVLDDVDYFMALHLGTVAKTNEILIDPDNFLCTTKLDFRFYGKPAHAGAEPHLGKNALAAACHCAIQLLGISRHGEGSSQINVGVIRAGEGRNVVPAYGELQIEVRGENEEINNFMAREAERMAQGAALSFNLRLESEVMGEAVDLTNDKVLIDLLADVVKQYPQLTAVAERSFGGSEDATILAKRVQHHGGKALYFIIGADLKAGHHQAEFDFDEQQLVTGVTLFSDCLKKLLA